MTESCGSTADDDQTRFVDELDRVYEALEDASQEAQTQRENHALALIHAATDYGRDVGLQREFPTPNQKLFAHVSGEDLEQPDDPGSWEVFREQHEALQVLEDSENAE